MKKLALLLIILLIVGCEGISTVPREAIVGIISVQVGLATQGDARPTPSPTPDDESHKREDCPTDGWVKHGDGHISRCPDCRPPWTAADGAGISYVPQEVETLKVESEKTSAIQDITYQQLADTENRKGFWGADIAPDHSLRGIVDVVSGLAVDIKSSTVKDSVPTEGDPVPEQPTEQPTEQYKRVVWYWVPATGKHYKASEWAVLLKRPNTYVVQLWVWIPERKEWVTEEAFDRFSKGFGFKNTNNRSCSW